MLAFCSVTALPSSTCSKGVTPSLVDSSARARWCSTVRSPDSTVLFISSSPPSTRISPNTSKSQMWTTGAPWAI
eukprot:7384192-Prymnesium_polylepis.1